MKSWIGTSGIKSKGRASSRAWQLEWIYMQCSRATVACRSPSHSNITELQNRRLGYAWKKRHNYILSVQLNCFCIMSSHHVNPANLSHMVACRCVLTRRRTERYFSLRGIHWRYTPYHTTLGLSLWLHLSMYLLKSIYKCIWCCIIIMLYFLLREFN